MKHDCAAFTYWQNTHNAPCHFPVSEDQWYTSVHDDVDSNGKKLFDKLVVRYSRPQGGPLGVFNGMIAYGTTAFGFNEKGELCDDVHHKVIRDLCFDATTPKIGQDLLDAAMADLGQSECIYAFFHYFGMSACARHGKLHESQRHIHDLLLRNGFCVEHENVYYARELTDLDVADKGPGIAWRDLNAGGCREFAAIADGDEIGWGQVHFLPQGHIAYLRWIYIDEKRQHQGLGTATMRTLCAQLYQMGITRFDTDTALQNTAAQGYYEKTGFANKGITRSYYKEIND